MIFCAASSTPSTLAICHCLWVVAISLSDLEIWAHGSWTWTVGWQEILGFFSWLRRRLTYHLRLQRISKDVLSGRQPRRAVATEYRLRPHVWVEGGECQKGAERGIDYREASINTTRTNTTRLSLQEKYLTDFGQYDLDKPPTDEGWAVEKTACGSQLESSSDRHISLLTHTHHDVLKDRHRCSSRHCDQR